MSGPLPSLRYVVLSAILWLVPTTTWWQPKLGGEPGEVVELDAELAQSLSIVLLTPENSVPGRPGFGSRLYQYVDLPLNQMVPLAVREVFRAVGVSEPRITILGALPTMGGNGAVSIAVRWRPTNPTTPSEARERTTPVDMQRSG